MIFVRLLSVFLIHWNCRGYRANYEDIRALLSKLSPACFLLQETMLGLYTPHPPSGYTIHTSSTSNPVPGDGLAVLVRHGTPFLHLPLDTNLQAVAFRVRSNKLYSICNIYLPPNANVSIEQLTHLIDQLPPPFILAGDFNARHPLWGDTQHNRVGDIV